ncbi:MAG: sigma-54-dependent Fis family transcriptional regulator [Candidatus Binatia bacterium]
MYKSSILADQSAEARIVRNLRDRFLAGRDDGLEAVRPVIRESWLRCRAGGVDPGLKAAPLILSADAVRARRERSELRQAAAPVLRMLCKALDGRCFLVVLADADCHPIEVLGHPQALDAAEQINVVPGSQWRENQVGTDALAVSALLGVPVQIHWAENYVEMLGDRWTGNAAPIQRGGIVSVYGYDEVAHPHALDLVADCAAMIDARLGERELRRTMHLLEAYRLHQTRYPSDPLVCMHPDGAVVSASVGVLDLLGLGGERGGRVLGSGLHRLSASAAAGPGVVDLPSPTGDPVRAMVTPVRADDDVVGFLISPAQRPAPKSLRSRSSWTSAHNFADVVGESEALRACVSEARRLAARDLPVLITGESGSGKELFAHAIHESSPRRDGPFVPLNCGGLAEELLAAELFGYADGAFTGAARGGRPGKVELAHGGTLFLDELEEMSPRMQVHLLRVLEDARVVRIGDDKPRSVDVRIIAATKVSLAARSAAGQFREDLFHRLNVFTLGLPPLRERPGDVPLIARHILTRQGIPAHLTPDACAMLEAHTWPGNVRELRNVLLQAAERAADGEITPALLTGLLPPAARPNASSAALSRLEQAEKDAIVRTLREAGGNVSRAAAALRLHRVTLHRKMERYAIRVSRTAH